MKSWAQTAGYKLQTKKSKVKRKVSTLLEVRKLGVDNETILQFGMKQNSWKEAAVQFGVSLYSVQSLAKRAGYNLNVKKYSDDFKKIAVSFGEKEGWRAAATKFGVGTDRVREWAKKKKRELVLHEEVKQEINNGGDKCDVCGLMLAVNETLEEHEVSRHLTVDGLCDICGEDSEDFIEHFKIHLKIKSQELQLPSLGMLGNVVKEETMSVDDNQVVDSDSIEVKEEKGEGSEIKGGGRWVANPFYIC